MLNFLKKFYFELKQQVFKVCFHYHHPLWAFFVLFQILEVIDKTSTLFEIIQFLQKLMV